MFTDVAQMLPTEVILDVLGIGHEHSLAAVAVADSLIAMHEPTATDATIEEADRSFRAFADLVVAEAPQRRAQPRADLLTALVQAADGSDALSDEELIAMVSGTFRRGRQAPENLLVRDLSARAAVVVESRPSR